MDAMNTENSGEGYLPLYAERRCLVCGYWRGRHVCDGDARNDSEMLCPVDASWFQVTASFVPGPRHVTCGGCGHALSDHRPWCKRSVDVREDGQAIGSHLCTCPARGSVDVP